MVAALTPNQQAVARAFPALYAKGLITVEAPPEDAVIAKRNSKRDLQRSLRAHRREHNLCIKCGGVRVDGITLCAECRDYAREATRKHRGSRLCSRA